MDHVSCIHSRLMVTARMLATGCIKACSFEKGGPAACRRLQTRQVLQALMAQKTLQTLKSLQARLQGAIKAAQRPTLVTGMLCHCNSWSVAEDKASIFCA